HWYVMDETVLGHERNEPDPIVGFHVAGGAEEPMGDHGVDAAHADGKDADDAAAAHAHSLVAFVSIRVEPTLVLDGFQKTFPPRTLSRQITKAAKQRRQDDDENPPPNNGLVLELIIHHAAEPSDDAEAAETEKS